MKKIFALSLILFSIIFSSPLYAKDKSTEETWAEIGEQGVKALKEAGKFFKDAGTEIGNTLKDSLKDVVEVHCYGTWVYKNKRCTTIITCNENGTMEIVQKEGIDSKYWKGTFSATGRFISFFVEEKGERGMFTKNKNVQQISEKWFLTYKVEKQNSSLKFTSNNIPSDSAGTDFSQGLIFTKK